MMQNKSGNIPLFLLFAIFYFIEVILFFIYNIKDAHFLCCKKKRGNKWAL